MHFGFVFSIVVCRKLHRYPEAFDIQDNEMHFFNGLLLS